MAITFEMGFVMAVSAIALALFVTEAIPPDVVALLAMFSVMVAGVVTPEEALAGFANPAVHTVAAMFILSAGLIRTGAVEAFTRWLLRYSGKTPRRVIALTLVAVTVLSSFMNNTPIVVMMIPVAFGISEAHGIAPSKLLIPISYAAIAGGLCTLIGTSTNLVVSGLAEQAGMPPISMFELTPLGLAIAVGTLLYLGLFGPKLLPERVTVTTGAAPGRIREYLTELVLRPGCPLAGRCLDVNALSPSGDLRVVEVIRGDEILWPPFAKLDLHEEDVLLVRGPVHAILDAARRSGVDVIPELAPESLRVGAVNQTLAEIVISPGSRLVGATIPEIGFRQHFAVSILALQRHGRHHAREKLASTRLRVGDVLLAQGDAAAVEHLKDEEGIILLEGLDDGFRDRSRIPIAAGTLLAVILCATLTSVPVVACAIGGAVFMLLTRCITSRQIYRSLDGRTLVLIAAMIGLGTAAEKSGATHWLAAHIIDVARPLGPLGILAVVYLMTNALTEFLSNAAAAVLMFPLAISSARELGDVSERPFVVAVAIAASAAFATPIGYQTNTIVYGPGGYRFSDYARIGLPLNFILFAISMVLIPVLWPF